jgi:CS1 type fimbrial major subunit
MKAQFRWSMAMAWCCLASATFAQEAIRHVVSVEIDVPHRTDAFQVIDIGGWSGQVQKMAWDHARQRLMPLRRQLHLKSSGCIKASLNSLPRLSNRDGDIALAVSIGGVVLPESLGSVEVVDASGAPLGKVAEFVVEPASDPVDGYKSGLYQGSVSILFESGVGAAGCS